MVDPEILRDTFNQTDKPLMDKLREIVALGRQDALAEVDEILADLRWEQQRLYLPEGAVSETLEKVEERVKEL